ncbi:MAG: hypothetical protein JSR26_01470 [Proteobacteria bacterium]|nr:hypothetical protein [Pseudomonadota bacterium]
MTAPAIRSHHATWLLLACACLTVLVYWPSLHGGYIFDDAVYFVDNTDVHVTTLHLSDWLRAALNQAGTLQFRALSMLSFAANYYFTGLDPFWPKLTNLLIHLLNGTVLFLLLRELFALTRLTRSEPTQSVRHDIAAAMLAGAWLLLPINFTGVAYVAQRMESLANLFVFMGLYWYLRARQRQFTAGGRGIGLGIGILAGLLLGYSAKESAVLLPLYTACIEFSITRFRNADGRYSRPAVLTHVAFLLLPLVAGLAWVATWVFKSMGTFRTFSIGQRLLTEPRVFMDYIGWTLLPNINTLTFYHDDLLASHGLLSPPTTLASILAVLALLAVAVWQRKARPLFCLGITWFFAGQMLTGTVIPLELVFEHRNYFPSAGLLLAVASLLALEPGLRRPLLRISIAIAFLAWCGFTTFLRSEEWSHPLRLAYAEALKRPDSPRAQYDLASTLIRAAGQDTNSSLIGRATTILERNAYQPDAGIAPLQALIFLNGRAHKPIDPRWWQEIVAKLRHGAPSQTDLSAVIFLFRCQQRGDCPDQPAEMLQTFVAALDSSGGDPNVTAAYADFALERLHDPDLAVRLARAVVASRPGVLVYRISLTKILIATHRLDEARAALDDLRRRDRAGALGSSIRALQSALLSAESRSEPAPSTHQAGAPALPPDAPNR